jgi:hypothetical protein
MTFYQCSGPASGCGSVRQRYGSDDPDSHPDPSRTKMSQIHNTSTYLSILLVTNLFSFESTSKICPKVFESTDFWNGATPDVL